MWKDGGGVCVFPVLMSSRAYSIVCVCLYVSHSLTASGCLSDSVLVLSLFLNISQKLCVSVILSGFCLSLCPDICLSLFPASSEKNVVM